MTNTHPNNPYHHVTFLYITFIRITPMNLVTVSLYWLLVLQTGAGCWTIIALSHWLFSMVDIVSPAATRRLQQTFICCVCASVRMCVSAMLALVVVRLENVGANRTMRRRRQNTWHTHIGLRYTAARRLWQHERTFPVTKLHLWTKEKCNCSRV